jgi:hypothetical protein
VPSFALPLGFWVPLYVAAFVMSPLITYYISAHGGHIVYPPTRILLLLFPQNMLFTCLLLLYVLLVLLLHLLTLICKAYPLQVLLPSAYRSAHPSAYPQHTLGVATSVTVSPITGSSSITLTYAESVPLRVTAFASFATFGIPYA